jgi:hypothetical protein
MNADVRRTKFRKQFDQEDWDKIMNDPEFTFAWNLGDFDKAGLLADRLIIGEAKTSKEAKKKKFDYDMGKKYR